MGVFKDKKAAQVVLLCLPLFLVQVSCNGPEVDRGDVVLTENSVFERQKRQTSKLRILPLKVERSATARYDWKRLPFSDKVDFFDADFSDNGNGWARSNNRDFFRFTRGGEEILTLGKFVSEQERISDFAVIDNEHVVITVNNKSSYSRPGPLWIVRTTNGGETWVRSKLLSDAYVNKLIFAPDGVGWLIGGRVEKDYGSLRVTPLLMRSTNGGESWLDLSDNISRIFEPSKRNVNNFDDITITSSGSIQVIFNNYQIWESINDGGSWKVLGDFPDVGPYQKGFLYSNHDEVGFIVSGSGKHGTYTVFLKQGKESGWSAASLGKISIVDFVYRSKEEIFASGSILPENYGESNGFRRNAVILYSNDGGESWEISYETEDATILFAIRIIGNEKVVAVGREGLIVSATLWDR